MSLFHRKAQPVSTAPPAPDTSSLVVPGLEAYAARAGWTALGAQPFRESFGDFVTSVSAAFVGESSNTSGTTPSAVSHITTLERDDWAFMMGFFSVTCVCSEPFGTVDDVTARLTFLQTLVRTVPADVATNQTSAFPKLPDGTLIDVTHPEKLRDALLKLTPEEQAQVLDQFPHMTPEKRAQIISQVKLHQDHGNT